MTVSISNPTSIGQLHQQGLLERAFHDGLLPYFLFRNEMMRELWPAHTGEQIFMTRPGLLTPVTVASTPGQDPVPQQSTYEQWSASLKRLNGTKDVHMPTSATANADLFLRDVKTLGIQAGQSLNQAARNAIFKAYLGGNTVTLASISSTDTTVRVAALSGFRDVLNVTTNIQPVPVSSSTPLTAKLKLASGDVAVSIIAAAPDSSADPDGPGTLTLAAAIGGSGAAARTPLISDSAPKVFRAGGGNSVDALQSGDILTMQDIINARAYVRSHNAPMHDDGTLHGHAPSLSLAQFYADPAFQRLYTGQPNDAAYQTGAINNMIGVKLWEDNESPDWSNAGARTSTGTSAMYSAGIAAETTNENGVNVGRVLILAKGAAYEKYLDESAYVSEAGITGKIGDFNVSNNGIQIETNGIRFILRAPLNRLQDQVSISWSWSGDFPVPSDITALSGAQRFKRAAIIEFALS